MRICSAGIDRNKASFQLSFDGRPVIAYPGESLAAALLSADERMLRITSAGQGRGLFCGMGVCGECTVIVDGVSRRACMTPAQSGQSVTTAPARAAVGPVPPAQSALPTATPDVLVIGAGPAGLSAARSAALAGLSVLVADERGKAGGQYFKQPGSGFKVDPSRIDQQFREGADLFESTKAAGVQFIFDTQLWSAERDAVTGALRLGLLGAGRIFLALPKRLVLATGAYERAFPFPGWTLPGVMTTGACQTLLRAYQTAPGRRVLVAGNGPLNLQVAVELQHSGVEVVALIEQASAPSLARVGDAARLALSAPNLVGDGIAQLALLRRKGVPLLYRHVVVEAEGEGAVRRVRVGQIGQDGHIVPASIRTFEADALCVGMGFLPQAEVARALGCRFDDAPGGPGLIAVRDAVGRSSVDNVFIVGDGGGLGGARVAMAQGMLAGTEAATDLGQTLSGGLKAESAAARRALARHLRFQKALWRLYAPAKLCGPVATAQTLLCRCEDVSYGTIEKLIAGGLTDIGSIKRQCRAGMGRCQGRYCGALIRNMLGSQPGASLDKGFAPRSPFKPVPIAALASSASSAK